MLLKEKIPRPPIPTRKPVISTLLPKVFSEPEPFTHKKLKDHQDLTAMNEFKIVKNLLSPISQVSPESKVLRKIIHKLESFPKITSLGLTLENELLCQSIRKLEEMVTLGVMRSSSVRSGIVRKSLHAPTLKLYASKEIPVGTLLIRQKLIEILKNWQRVQRGCQYLVDVNSSFWNCPEGCVTIIMEHMNGDSLFRLCESIGAAPEQVLRGVAKRVLSGLSYFHKKLGPYGGLDLSHVLFTRDGKVKLSLALGSRLQVKDDVSKKQFSIEEDVFDLGCVFLAAAIGGNDWMIELLMLKGGCCLFHAALSLSEIPYLSRFSKEFCSFLCMTTKFVPENRAKVLDLASHEWFKNIEETGPDVSLKELLDMSVVGQKEAAFDKQIEILCENLKVVLSEYPAIGVYNKVNVKELAKELGVSYRVLSERFDKIYVVKEEG